MKKSHKIAIGAIVGVLAISVAILVGKPDLFQGSLFRTTNKLHPNLDLDRIFLYNGKIVSAVTSPVTSAVPSVVVSKVTSPCGTSKVASVVVSAITSPVTSAVPLNSNMALKYDPKKLKTITEKTLKTFGKDDFRKNLNMFKEQEKKDYKLYPNKFTLSKEKKQALIDLYKLNNPAEFIFEPVQNIDVYSQRGLCNLK